MSSPRVSSHRRSCYFARFSAELKQNEIHHISNRIVCMHLHRSFNTRDRMGRSNRKCHWNEECNQIRRVWDD